MKQEIRHAKLVYGGETKVGDILERDYHGRTARYYVTKADDWSNESHAYKYDGFFLANLIKANGTLSTEQISIIRSKGSTRIKSERGVVPPEFQNVVVGGAE